MFAVLFLMQSLILVQWFGWLDGEDLTRFVTFIGELSSKSSFVHDVSIISVVMRKMPNLILCCFILFKALFYPVGCIGF